MKNLSTNGYEQTKDESMEIFDGLGAANAISRTQNEAVAWAKQQVGKWIDQDGAYGAQCVDLTKAYGVYLGTGAFMGNAKDYATFAVPTGWTRYTASQTSAQAGDILIWLDGSYGHVGIAVGNNTTIEQNVTAPWDGSGVTHQLTRSNYQISGKTLYGVLRPSFKASGPDLTNYHTVNPGKVRMLGSFNIYKDTTVTTVTGNVTKNQIVSVTGIGYTSLGYPMLKVAGGYISANKASSVKAIDSIDNYHTVNPGKIRMLGNLNVYKDTTVTTTTGSVTKNQIVTVTGIEYTSLGYPMLKVAGGYISANKASSVKAIDGIDNYHTVNPGKIRMLGNLNVYKDTTVTTTTGSVTKNQIITVTGIEYTSLGYPMLKVAGGYISANKASSVKAIDGIDNYHTVNPGKVKMLGNFNVYKDTTVTTTTGTVVKDQTVIVYGIEYTTLGYPMLKVDGGYISANKASSEKVN